MKDAPSAWKRPSKSLTFAGPNVSMILGMTSPLRTTLTLSPIDTPNLSTSPTLCNVVFSTVTPLTTTGATRATGVTAPVRPVCQSMPSRTVRASSGGNFQASAHRGWCAVWPSNSRLAKLSTLKTTPSISQGASSLPSVQRFVSANKASVVSSSPVPSTTTSSAGVMPTSRNQAIASLSFTNWSASGLSG